MPDKLIETLMLIDDNRVDRMVYQRMIARSGIVGTLLEFDYAERALDYLRTADQPPSLILLDINMPRMNGFEFLELVEEEFGKDFAPVIVMLTTSLDKRDQERARKSRLVRDFLNKPFTIDHLSRLTALI